MEEFPFRGLKNKPIVIRGEAAKKLVEEIKNPKPMSEERKAFFMHMREMRKKQEIYDSLVNTKKFIQEGHYSNEELQGLLEVIQNRLNEK